MALRKTVLFALVFVALNWSSPSPLWGGELYSFNVNRIRYDNGPGGFVVNDSFETDFMVGDDVYIGPGVVTDPLNIVSDPAWWKFDPDSSMTSGLVATPTSQALQMTFTGSGMPRRWGAHLMSGTVNNWTPSLVSAVGVCGSNFTGTTTPGVIYEFGTMITVPGEDFTVNVDAGWYSGMFAGNPVDHMLILRMRSGNWAAPEVFLPGPFDPSTTSIQLGIYLQADPATNSTVASGWYGIDGANAQVLGTHTFQGIVGNSFPDSLPGVYGGFETIPEPSTMLLTGIGLAAIMKRRRRRHSTH